VLELDRGQGQIDAGALDALARLPERVSAS
jgi:hypothetical protein